MFNMQIDKLFGDVDSGGFVGPGWNGELQRRKEGICLHPPNVQLLIRFRAVRIAANHVRQVEVITGKGHHQRGSDQGLQAVVNAPTGTFVQHSHIDGQLSQYTKLVSDSNKLKSISVYLL